MSKNEVHEVSIIRLLLLIGAIIAGLIGREEVASTCALGFILSLILL